MTWLALASILGRDGLTALWNSNCAVACRGSKVVTPSDVSTGTFQVRGQSVADRFNNHCKYDRNGRGGGLANALTVTAPMTAIRLTPRLTISAANAGSRCSCPWAARSSKLKRWPSTQPRSRSPDLKPPIVLAEVVTMMPTRFMMQLSREAVGGNVPRRQSTARRLYWHFLILVRPSRYRSTPKADQRLATFLTQADGAMMAGLPCSTSKHARAMHSRELRSAG
jgi:hypothetical protein